MSDRLRTPSPMAYSMSRRSSPEPIAYERYLRSDSRDLVHSARHSHSLGDISRVDSERYSSQGRRDSLSSCSSPRFQNYSDFPESGGGPRAESPGKTPWRSGSHEDIFSSHKRLSKLQQELMSANKKIGRMDVLYEEMNKRKGRLQEELLEACTKVAKLEATCASHQEKETHLQKELAVYHERNNKLELDVLAAFKKVSQLDSELEALEGKKSAVQRDRIAAQERISLLEAANDKMMKQRTVKSDAFTTNDRKVAELEAKIKKCAQENEELKNDVRRAKSKNVLVEGELNRSEIEKANLSGKLYYRETSPVEEDSSVEILLEELNRFKELYHNALKANPEARDYKRLLTLSEEHKEECARAKEKLNAMLEYESKFKEEKVRAEETRVELNGAVRKLALAEQQLQKALKEKAAFAMEIGKSNDKGIKNQEALTRLEKEVTRFMKLYEESEKRAQEFDAQLQKTSKERQDLAEQRQVLVRELEEADAELEQVLSVSEDLKSRLDSLSNAAVTAEQQYGKLTRAHQALTEDLEESNAALSTVKSELTRCKRQLNEYRDSADSLEYKGNEGNKRVKQLTLEVEEANEKLEKKVTQVAELESKLKSCQNEKEGITDEFYNLQDKVIALEGQMIRVEREKTGQESEREELEMSLGRSNEETKKLRKQLGEQKSESESAFRKSQDDGLKAKQCFKELETLEAKYNTTAVKLSDVERKYDAIVGERQELRRDVLKAESDVAQLERSLNLVSKENGELVSEVERLSSHKNRRDSVVVKLENDLLQVKTLHEQLVEKNQEEQVKSKNQTQELESVVEISEAKSAQVDELVERCEALKLERKDLREDVMAVKEQCARLQTQLDKEFREKENVRDELNEATRKVKRREEDIKLLEEKHQEQGDLLDKGNRRSRDEQGQMRSLKQELEMQAGTYQEKCREFESVKAKLETFQQECEGKKKEILNAEGNIGKLESRVLKLEREKSELASEIASRGNNMAKQSEGFTKLQKQLKDVKESLVNSQQQGDELQEQNKRQGEENRALFKQLTEKNADCVELETNVKELQSSKSNLSREVKKHRGKCEDLEKETESEFKEKLKLTEQLKSSEEMKQRACNEVGYLKEQLKEYKTLYEANMKDSVVRRDSLDKKTFQHEELYRRYSKQAIELSEVEKRLEEARAGNAKLKKDCFMKQAKVAKLEELLQKAMQENEEFGQMGKELRETQEDLKYRNEELDECEVEIHTLKLRVCELEASRATLEKSNAVLKESNESARVEESLKKLRELEEVYQKTALAKQTLEWQLKEAHSLLAESETQAQTIPGLQQRLERREQELSDVEFQRSVVSKENIAFKEKLVKLEDKLSVVEGEKRRLADELKKTQSPRKAGYSRGGLFVGKPNVQLSSASSPGGCQTSTPLSSPRIAGHVSRSFEVTKSKPKLTRMYSLDSYYMNSALQHVNGRLSTSLDNLTLDWPGASAMDVQSRLGPMSESADQSFESVVGSEVSSDSLNVRGMVQQLEKPSPTDKLSRSAEDWETVSDVSSAAWTVDESVLTDVEGDPDADLSDTASVKNLKQHFEPSVKPPQKVVRKSPSLTTLLEKHEESTNSEGDTNFSDVRTSQPDVSTNISDSQPKSPIGDAIVELDVKIIETVTTSSDTETKPQQLVTSKSPTNSEGETKSSDVSTSSSNAPVKSSYPDPGTKLDVIIHDTLPTPPDSADRHSDVKIENVPKMAPDNTKPFVAIPKIKAKKTSSFVDSAVRYTTAGLKPTHDSRLSQEEDTKGSEDKSGMEGTRASSEDKTLSEDTKAGSKEVGENYKLQVQKSGAMKPKAPRVNVRNMKSLWDMKLIEPPENKRKERQPIERSDQKGDSVPLSASKETVDETSGVSDEVSVSGDAVVNQKQAKVSDLVNLFSG